MALILKDRVRETTLVSGANDVALAGPVIGFQAFSVLGNNNTTYYCIAGQGTNEWEVGIGTYVSGTNTLERTTVLANSAGTEPTRLSFSAGIKDVFVTYPSGKSVNLDASGNVSPLGTIASGTWQGSVIAVPYGGTGAATLTGYVKGSGSSALTASATIPNTDITGLGTMSTQNASSVAITGGTIDGVTIGGASASAGAFTTLSASSTVSGTGFSTYLASPPAIGGTAAAAGTFTNLAYTGTLTGGTGVINIGSGQIYKDASGNVGIGVTPSAWGAGWKALEIGYVGGALFSNTNGSVGITANAVLTGSGWRYAANGFAQFSYAAPDGSYQWSLAPSGTAGSAISFTQAMTLSGTDRTDLLIGSTSAGYSTAGRGTVDINGSSTALLALRTGGTNRGYLYTQGTDMIAWAETGSFTVGTATAQPIVFTTNNTERARIDSSGNVGIGTSSPVSRLAIAGGGVTIGGFQAGSGSNLELGFDGTQTIIQGYNRTGSSFLPVWIESSLTRFGVGGVERARIDSSGNLLVGTTSNPSGARTRIYAVAQWGMDNEINASSGSHIVFKNTNGIVGSISSSGSSTAYNTSSDYRLKENVQPMQNALAAVAQLNPVTYTWKSDGSDGQGFIAHELQAVVPDCVTGEKDAIDKDGKPVYQGVDTSFLVATLTKAIQEQQAMIQTLQAEVADLKSKVQA